MESGDLVSWSTVSFDHINGEIRLGGPSSYGGSLLNFLSIKHHLRYRQIINISRNEAKNLPNFVLADSVLIDTPTVRFDISLTGARRKVKLLSSPYKIDKKYIHYLMETSKFEGLLISPIINEFTECFFKALKETAFRNIYIDLFNNDDGIFSEDEEELLKVIVNHLSKYKKIYLKFSENEYHEVKDILGSGNKSLKVLITHGKNGVTGMDSREQFHLPGERNEKVTCTLGAGDVFFFSFASLHLLGYSFYEAAKTANKYASVSTQYKTPNEIYNGILNK